MQVWIFVPTNVHSLEVAGLMDVFAEANTPAGQRFYDVRIIAEETRPICCGSGMRLLPDSDYKALPGAPDTLLVAGSVGIPDIPNTGVLEWLARTGPRARRFGSVCTGAFLLGDAGLLDGRRVTTHWQYAALLAERFPEAIVDSDRLFVRDDVLITSAGSSAAIDLGLSLVEEDLGRAVSLYVARRLVVYLKRPGDQSQFSIHLLAQGADRTRLYDVQQHILNHPAADLSVSALASVAAMSARNFTRVFTKEVGISPSEYVNLARIDVARSLLEGTSLSIGTIAAKSGFGSVRAMRRAFLARLGATPAEYRERFESSGDGARPPLS
ncbi:GlxA family transcriptional regulator [Chthonobacter rhizosphaerae]|uniref:GlxA family transcriptional regulator n=1 Tax=Chthonobacter rhizosphaerae TaxID=2735553 RepID=UPI0015EE7C78|nr:helix-turn-helix domain-containing protein [Chthonobacter rhizosphaerae]